LNEGLLEFSKGTTFLGTCDMVEAKVEFESEVEVEVEFEFEESYSYDSIFNESTKSGIK
jgi:hypothetical protein